jgi:hypothetical protein
MTGIRLTPLAAIAVLIGCAAGPPPTKSRVAVQEFQLDGTATVVTGYHDSVDELGRKLAEVVADNLRSRDHDATVVPRGAVTPEADLVVIGRISKIDGGSRAARAFMSVTLGFGLTDYGAGGGSLRADGRVVRPDGKTVGLFGGEHKEKATGYFWARFGGSAEDQIGGCIDEVGEEIAGMVDEGQYHGAGRQILDPQNAAPTGAATRPAADRLRELDGLHQQGLLSDAEYQEKRRKLLEEL